MIDRSEPELVNDFRNGSRDAFTKLVERYQNLVTSVALAKTGDIQKSEDIAQQTFLIAWEKQSELSDNSRFGGWVRNIAVNLSKNENRLHYNVNQKSSVSIEPENEPESPNQSPDVGLSQQEQQDLLWTTLESIPPEYSEPMILFYREDKSVATVAELLGISEDAAKQRLRRGRAMLKEEIESFVEQTLYETRPSAVFLAGVMAAIPSASSVTKATLSSTVVAGVKSMFSMIGSGGFIGSLFGGLGAMVGVGGAWIGSNYAAKQATSEEEKKLIWWFFKLVLVQTLAFVVIMLTTVFCLGTYPLLRNILLPIDIFLFVTLTIGQMIYFNKRSKELHSKHGKPEYLAKYETNSAIKPISTLGLRANAIGMLAGSWLWIPIFAGTQSNYAIIFCSILCIFALCALAWVWAPVHTRLSQQIRYNGKLFKLSAVLQSIFLFISWICLRIFAPERLAEYGELTGLYCVLFVGGLLVFSFCLAWFTDSKARELEKKTETLSSETTGTD